MFKRMDKSALQRLAHMEVPREMNFQQMQQVLHAMARSTNPQMLLLRGGISGPVILCKRPGRRRSDPREIWEGRNRRSFGLEITNDANRYSQKQCSEVG
jgi:hypothetical protein